MKWALERPGPGGAVLPLPGAAHPPEMVTYLGKRNIAIFSTDMDSFDFKMRKPEQVVEVGHDQARRSTAKASC